MTTLTAGIRAPNFSLADMNGNVFSLREALQRGPAVAAFFKVSCPVCQYAFPFLDRMYRDFAGKDVSFIGISQNDLKDTSSFLKKYGVSFPILMDDPKTFAVSNAYGLTNVPSIFLISPEAQIQLASVGWSKKDMENLALKLTGDACEGVRPLFRPEEKIAEFRAG